ncbi:MAG TPA: dienelactone hydrolase family protein [Noviherbaspirillum sp.]|nr:dienelactone hydrolase family protein [Noviherbaspirillum sp.]
MTPKDTEIIALPNGGKTQVVRPHGTSADQQHAVLLLSAIAGVNSYVQERARDLASEGFLVAILDYFGRDGAVPDISTPELIGKAVAALDDRQVLADVDESVKWFDRQGIPAANVGVLGFCIGGSYAILAASRAWGLGCAVNYYGQLSRGTLPPSDLKPHAPIDVVDSIGCPILCHYGDHDRLIGAHEIEAFTTKLRQAQKSYELFTYAGAPHAFDEWFRQQVYRPVASALAWRRSLAFLGWHLCKKKADSHSINLF